jgi:hypothetical protein
MEAEKKAKQNKRNSIKNRKETEKVLGKLNGTRSITF